MGVFMQRVRYVALVVVASGLAGCGGDGLRRVQIQGKLTAKGQPVDGAAIVFLPLGANQGESGVGASDKEGRFTLSSSTSSRKPVQGVVPGQYRVRINRRVAGDGSPLPPDATQADHPGSRETIPAKYTSPDGSPLQVTVPESGGPLTVDIPEGLVKGSLRDR
jgi:hypothetical protein